MKKLNRKGFTLIELLAVIVIMAIILVVTIPTILNSISDARISSIQNLAVSTANSYNTIAANDLIAVTPQLSTAQTVGTNWVCINEELAKVLDLPTTDVIIDEDGTAVDPSTTSNVVAGTCSAIKVNASGKAEVLLVATASGKFANAGSTVYGLSTAPNGGSNPNPA